MTDFESIGATLAALSGVTISVLVVIYCGIAAYYYRKGVQMPPNGGERFCWHKHMAFWALAAHAINAAFWGGKWVAALIGAHETAMAWSVVGGLFDIPAKFPAAYAGASGIIAVGGVGAGWLLHRLKRTVRD